MLQRRRDKSHCGERELVWISSAFLLHHASPVQHYIARSRKDSDAISDMTQFGHKLERHKAQGYAISFHPSRCPCLKETAWLFSHALLNTLLPRLCQYPLCPQIPELPLHINSQDLSQDSDWLLCQFLSGLPIDWKWGLNLGKKQTYSPGTGWVSLVLAVQTSVSALPGAQPSSVLGLQIPFSHWYPFHSFLLLPG